jgi:hypothetical protein
MRKRKPSGRKAAVPEAMVKETFEEELVAAMPELAADLEALRASWGDDKPGVHIVVGDVLGKHVERAVDAGAWWQIHTACHFMERMATSLDEELRNALTVSLLENLGDDRERLEKARLAMGPKTLTLSHEIERFWARET